MEEGAHPSCPICLDDFTDDNPSTSLDDCGHNLHVSCAIKWFRSGSQTCPLCRADPKELLTYLDIRTRGTMLRRFARRSDAPRKLQKAVERLRDKERERKELGAALRAVRQTPCWGIVKQYRSLLKKSHAKTEQIRIAHCRLGLMECDGVPEIPLSIVRVHNPPDIFE
jgi:hypothetical protein